MERTIKQTLSKVGFNFQRYIIKVSCQVKSIAAMPNLEDESTESNRFFSLLSLMLLISLLFLSPDKIQQALTPTEMSTGIFEKAQEIAKIIRKLIPSLG